MHCSPFTLRQCLHAMIGEEILRIGASTIAIMIIMNEFLMIVNQLQG